MNAERYTMTKQKPAPLWRYSLRWSLPHRPCPGPLELAVAEVLAGARCPPEVSALWRPGTGYAVCLDFPQAQAVRRWSDEQRVAVRKRNLVRRVERAAPLFADEFQTSDELDDDHRYGAALGSRAIVKKASMRSARDEFFSTCRA